MRFNDLAAIDDFRNNYRSGHATRVSSSVYQDVRVQWPYFKANYRAIEELPRTARIVEIGPGSGAFLAWLRQLGFSDALGIEVAGEEAHALAQQGFPVVQADALEMLSHEPVHSVDAFVFKAMLEHVTKDYAIDLFRHIARVMRPSGLVLVEVPNMDWLLSGHERYMDLTHQTGYTRESLQQLLDLFFRQIEIMPTADPITSWRSAIRVRFLRPLVVAGLRLAFRVLGEGASLVMFEARSIIAVARAPRS